jgi:glucose-6-phosphate-specific signal transduction histidine kinase
LSVGGAVELSSGAVTEEDRWPGTARKIVWAVVVFDVLMVGATVRLSALKGDLTFEIEDDGQGFDPATTPRGSGLTNMVDRLDALGGSVDFDSRPGNGTTLKGTLPVPQAAPA